MSYSQAVRVLATIQSLISKRFTMESKPPEARYLHEEKKNSTRKFTWGGFFLIYLPLGSKAKAIHPPT